MEDNREPLLFDQDDWATEEEYRATSPEWVRMGLLLEILPWIDGLYNR